MSKASQQVREDRVSFSLTLFVQVKMLKPWSTSLAFAGMRVSVGRLV